MKTAKEQYKAAYSAIRSRDKALREGLPRFAVYRKHYTVISRLNMGIVIAADKSYATRNDVFYGCVYFNWSPELNDHKKYGTYLPIGFASKMIPAYARRDYRE